MFNLSINNTVLRFYLMMVVAIIAVYTHQDWMIFLVIAIGVSAILGYRIGKPGKVSEGKEVSMEHQSRKAMKAS